MTMLMVPQIQSNDNFHVFEGHDLYLNCTLEIDLAQRAALSWELPSQDQAVKVGNAILSHYWKFN